MMRRVMQDDIRRKKLSLERVDQSREQMSEKLSDVNLQLDNADKAHRRAVDKKQARIAYITHDDRPSIRNETMPKIIINRTTSLLFA